MLTENSSIFTDRRKQQFESHKQSVVYNGYGPAETTLGIAFNTEVLPPDFSLPEKCLTVTDRVKLQLWQQNYLRIINVYGPAEAYIVSTETVITER